MTLDFVQTNVVKVIFSITNLLPEVLLFLLPRPPRLKALAMAVSEVLGACYIEQNSII